ncbi:MAG TPA: DUF362 domain-containing protein [Phycisphaerae bacterium]|nr:DUF362 domain-containing protein [Phycisphaerae bacterium]HOJ75955.1 DUF362 domain-containing protein [Phycisphaerae bacterium]HOM53369.1 DUF362 domain-containing protein [Phycisphaerae bacterium]HON67399.1 DUF362 domain-containing protein [Phycisphaerae bacterium]HOQ84456.1 DUF362 domain-containing protein [Phycisphaerae bacterium]
MSHQPIVSRRALLRGTARTVIGGWAAAQLPARVWAQAAASPPPGVGLPASQAALIAGDSRADNVFKALKLIEPQVRLGIARKKRVLVKPNLVVVNNQLAATHVECLEGILEFLKPIVKDEILIGDSPAGGQATEAFDNYKYHELAKRYNVKFINFDDMPTELRYVSDHRHQPKAVRMVKPLLDPDTYVISAAILKTHDRAICTLSLKNVVVGSAIKDKEFRWGGSKGSNDKVFIHGGPKNEAIHWNLFSLGSVVKPDLAVIDGFQGMEGNGPVVGTAVDHKVAVASTDFVAADRIGVELMGFDFQQVGYLAFCDRARLGCGDLSRIELLGEKIEPHKRKYRPHDTIEQQLEWMKRGV